MSLQPWNVFGAPAIQWRFPEDDDERITFDHIRTRVIDMGDDGCAKGFTMWAGDLEGNPVFMAFDWVELRPGVPILTDPNTILTNLSLLDQEDEKEAELREVAHLNVIAYRLQWQREAMAAARAHREQASQPTLHCRQADKPTGGYRREATEMKEAA